MKYIYGWVFMILGILFITGCLWAFKWDGIQCVGSVVCL